MLKPRKLGRYILKTEDFPHTQNHLARSWQILGKLDLFVETFADDALNEWLQETLNSITLTEDFLCGILDSVQQTVARILFADAKVKLDHIHLLVFAPSNRTSLKQVWGFFSVERLEDVKESDVANDHTIEIYLYAEQSEILASGTK